MIRFLTIVLLGLTCVSGQAQDDRADDLSDFIKKLCEHYDVMIAYPDDILEVENINTEVSLNQDIDVVLKGIFDQTKIQFYILDHQKILLRVNNKPMESSPTLYSGMVHDALTDTPLPFAAVMTSDGKRGTMTDENGKFIFKSYSSDTDTLLVQYLGYQQQKLACKTYKNNSVIRLNVVPYQFDEVTIIYEPKIIDQSILSNEWQINADKYTRLNASRLYGKDIIKSFQNLPGISAHNDRGGEIKVRGSSGAQTLTILDGIVLYKIDHYYGIFSAINSEFIEQAVLHKNQIPVQYQGRLGGMLQLSSKKSVKENSVKLQADFLKIAGLSEFKLGSKADISIAGRINHTDPFDTPLSTQSDDADVRIDLESLADNVRSRIFDSNPRFKFNDINLSTRFYPSESFSLSGHLIASNDKFTRAYNSVVQAVINNRKVLLTERFANEETWTNGGISIRSEYRISDDASANVDISYSKYNTNNNLGAKFNRIVGHDTLSNIYTLRLDNEIETLSSKIMYNYKESLFGIDLKKLHNRVVVNENRKKPELRSINDADEFALFASHRFYPLPKLKFTGAGRIVYYDLIDVWRFAPQLMVHYNIIEDFYLKTSIARSYQSVRGMTFENRFGQNMELLISSNKHQFPLGSADLYMAGFHLNHNKWSLDVEGFIKKARGTLGFFNTTPNAVLTAITVDPTLGNKYKTSIGNTNINGIDLGVDYQTERIFSQFSYTWSKSTVRYPDVFKNQAFPSADDRRHQLKFLYSYKVTQNLVTGINTVYASGRPYTSLELLQNGRPRDEIDFEDAIKRLNPYFRMDISVDYSFDLFDIDCTLGASVYNVTNHENQAYIQQTYAASNIRDRLNPVIIGTESNLLNRIYNLSLELDF